MLQSYMACLMVKPTAKCVCVTYGVFLVIFLKCVHLLMRTHQVTDAWHQEMRTVAYVITT